MANIKGVPIKLISKIEIGKDEFNEPIYEEHCEKIENVLISPASADDVVTALNLTGKKAVYQLAIPKEDNHRWEDKKVEFFGEVWNVFGIATKGIEENIPLEWNLKVMVERYES